jgi:hypothetical protein
MLGTDHFIAICQEILPSHGVFERVCGLNVCVGCYLARNCKYYSKYIVHVVCVCVENVWFELMRHVRASKQPGDKNFACYFTFTLLDLL